MAKIPRKLADWEKRMIEEAGYIQAHSIGPFDLTNSYLPHNGTIFSARLPPSARGGIGSDLRLHPVGNLFKGYHSHCILGNSDFFPDRDSIKRLRPRDICRFIVWDEDLETAHSVEERNWFSARLLRPLYLTPPSSKFSAFRDTDEQILVEPQDSEILFLAALSSYIKQGDSPPHIYHPVISNDLVQLRSLPKKTLEMAYKFLRDRPV